MLLLKYIQFLRVKKYKVFMVLLCVVHADRQNHSADWGQPQYTESHSDCCAHRREYRGRHGPESHNSIHDARCVYVNLITITKI